MKLVARRRTIWRLAALGWMTLWILRPLLAGTETHDMPPDSTGSREREVAAAVEDLKAAMSIRDPIHVGLVARNPRLVSVERAPGGDGFVLLFDQGFLADLEGDEIRAALAHELGHVWIFTHHPFLQTERLANQQALKVVSKDSLRRVYDKASQRGEELSFLKGVLD